MAKARAQPTANDRHESGTLDLSSPTGLLNAERVLTTLRFYTFG